MARPRVGRAFGGWSDDPLWATFYDWTVEHPRPAVCCGGSASAATCGCCTTPPRRSAGSRRARGSSTSPAAAGSRCAACGPARASRTSPPTSRRPCSTGRWRPPARRGVADQVEPRHRRRRRPAVRGRRRSTWWSSFTGLHCFPDPRPRGHRDGAGARARAACSPAARCSTTPARRYEPMRRIGRRAGLLGPGCTARRGTTWLADEGMTDVDPPGQRRRSATSARSSADPSQLTERRRACSWRVSGGRP